MLRLAANKVVTFVVLSCHVKEILQVKKKNKKQKTLSEFDAAIFVQRVSVLI